MSMYWSALLLTTFLEVGIVGAVERLESRSVSAVGVHLVRVPGFTFTVSLITEKIKQDQIL